MLPFRLKTPPPPKKVQNSRLVLAAVSEKRLFSGSQMAGQLWRAAFQAAPGGSGCMNRTPGGEKEKPLPLPSGWETLFLPRRQTGASLSIAQTRVVEPLLPGSPLSWDSRLGLPAWPLLLLQKRERVRSLTSNHRLAPFPRAPPNRIRGTASRERLQALKCQKDPVFCLPPFRRAPWAEPPGASEGPSILHKAPLCLFLPQVSRTGPPRSSWPLATRVTAATSRCPGPSRARWSCRP